MLNYGGDDVCGSRSRFLINFGLWLIYRIGLWFVNGFWLCFIYRSRLWLRRGCCRLGVLRAILRTECIFIIVRLFFKAVARSAVFVLSGSEHWD